MEHLSEEWVQALIAASTKAGDDQIGDRSGTIEFTIGKKRRAVVAMVDGRFVAGSDADDGSDNKSDVDLSVPMTDDQLSAYLSGDDSIAQAYIRGDVKPVGSSGPWLSFVELVESGALASLA